MPSTTALIRKIGVSMLASTALIQSSRPHSRKSPRGGPPALFTRMSGSGHAASAAARPASVVMSPGTAVTLTPVSLRISSAVFSRSAAVRAVITRSTPSRASDIAQARPSPLLAAQTIAFLPLMPRSMGAFPPRGCDTLSLRAKRSNPQPVWHWTARSRWLSVLRWGLLRATLAMTCRRSRARQLRSSPAPPATPPAPAPAAASRVRRTRARNSPSAAATSSSLRNTPIS